MTNKTMKQMLKWYIYYNPISAGGEVLQNLFIPTSAPAQ